MNQKMHYLILGADLLWMVVVFTATLSAPNGGGGSIALPKALPLVVAIAASVWAVLYFSKSLEGFRGGWYFPSVFAQVIVGVSYLMSALLGMALLANYSYRRSAALSLAGLLPLGFLAIRCLVWWSATLRSKARPMRRVVIAGSGRMVTELALKILRHPEMAMEVTGLLTPAGTELGKGAGNPPGAISLGSLNALNLMRAKKVQDLIVVEPVPPGPESLKLISNCRKEGIRVHLVPQHYELYLSKAKLREIDDVPLLSIEEQTLPVVGLQLKKLLDALGALCLMVLSTPLLAYSVAILHRRKKAVFRKELRCGRNGCPFWMYRLNIDRDALDLDAHERTLVHFSLTELPQLWNVLKGEMSLVGPRPESPDRVKHYSVWQRQRLNVTPGLTGLAQVHGLRERHSSEEKARFDLQYIFHWSLFLDISLLLQTVWTFLVRWIGQDGFRMALRTKVVENLNFSIPAVMNVNRTQPGEN